MAIYDLFEQQERLDTFVKTEATPTEDKKSLFVSSLLTRGCFFLLWLASAAWIVYSTFFLLLSCIGFCASGGKLLLFRRGVKKFFLMFRRSVISWISLAMGLFCPPFGIMVACTYFLMYDKAGMDEVIPASFQAQVKDIFQQNER